MADDFRSREGKRAALVAVIANCFLTILNISVGLMSGSSALVSEGAHTFSDIITTIVAYIGFHFSQKPDDFDHPLGYGRVEALSGLIIVAFLVLIAWEIIEKALKQIMFNQALKAPDFSVALMAVVGIIINFIVSYYIINVGNKIKSPAIVADGYHQKTDIFSSIVILIGVFVSNMGYPILDPIIAIVIGVLIIRTAYILGVMNINHVMGKIPSREFIKDIKNIAESIPQSYNAHDIKVDYFGNYAVVSLHIQLDGNLILKESHRIAHEVQDKILEEKPEIRYVIVHTCPLEDNYDHHQRKFGSEQ